MHAAGTRVVLHRLGPSSAPTGEIRLRHPWLRLASLFVLLFLLHSAEIGVWAGAYAVTGALDDFEQALYFSVVSYTTLGYGDVVLPVGWRILGASEAAIGTLMFGWSTGLALAIVSRLYRLGA